MAMVVCRCRKQICECPHTWIEGDLVKSRITHTSACGQNTIIEGMIYTIKSILDARKKEIGVQLTQEFWKGDKGWKASRFELHSRHSAFIGAPAGVVVGGDHSVATYAAGQIDLSQAVIGSKWKRRDGQMRMLTEKLIEYVILSNDRKTAEWSYEFSGKPTGTKEDCFQDIIAPWTEEKAESPKIEQKPLCACCQLDFIQSSKSETMNEEYPETIYHDDPCQFSSSERSMLPLAKKMFREMMQRQNAEGLARIKREDDLDEIEDIECLVARTGLIPALHFKREWVRLTGRTDIKLD